MKIICTNGIPNRYGDDVMDLLVMCDREFVPSLSSREDTSQTEFSNCEGGGGKPVTYYQSLKRQKNLLLIENGSVVGIMSYIEDYVTSATTFEMPNVYVSTLAIHKEYRHRGFASKFYHYLLKKYAHCHIYTRTWSTNEGHIRILSSLKFYEMLRLEDDRGPEIDTVYYHKSPTKVTFFTRLVQYRLRGNLVFFTGLMILTMLFIWSWLVSEGEMGKELSLAFATSLLASALCLLSDTWMKFQEAKNDDYLNRLKSFGISNLQFHKDELLEQIMPKCRNEIWISGYRLIMTAKKPFCNAIEKACMRNRGISIRVLLVPPWSEAYRLVYGEEDVIPNYYTVFKKLCECKEKYNVNLQIRFTKKPIFNDTYKVDERFITGPYLHCLDKSGARITAKDFFSLDIDDETKDLYQIMFQDYIAVWEDSESELDCDKFINENRNAAYEMDSAQKCEIIKRCCVKR